MKQAMPFMAWTVRSLRRACAPAAQGVDWPDANVVIEMVKTVKKPPNNVDAEL